LALSRWISSPPATKTARRTGALAVDRQGGELGAAQRAGEAHQDERAVANPCERRRKLCERPAQVLHHQRPLLAGRPAVGASDARPHPIEVGVGGRRLTIGLVGGRDRRKV
jgi:hypothetical protein